MNKKFRLEKVLEFRLKRLDREKQKLIELINEERAIIERMKETAEEIREAGESREKDAQAGDFSFIELYNKYAALKEKELRELESKRAEAARKTENQKATVKSALNDVKIMEKLKEKHLSDYAAYLKKLEEKTTDEINITRRRGDD